MPMAIKVFVFFRIIFTPKIKYYHPMPGSLLTSRPPGAFSMINSTYNPKVRTGGAQSKSTACHTSREEA